MSHAANTLVVGAALVAGGSAGLGTWGELATGEAVLVALLAVLVTMMVGGFAVSALSRSPESKATLRR